MRSEKEAFNRAMLMLKGTGVKIRSARLDRYIQLSIYSPGKKLWLKTYYNQISIHEI
jgi:transposase